MSRNSAKTAILLTLLGALCCFSIPNSGEWSINMKYTGSSKSRFYVLNNWRNTYTQNQATPFPAVRMSDVMLKTMGILKDGASWSGVQMKNMFSRPLATAIFLVDGLSAESSFSDLSEVSFGVDQTGLTGCTCSDTHLLFQGDNVATHLSDLFDGVSQTDSVSANIEAAQALSANGRYTTEEQISSLVNEIKTGKLSLVKYGLGTVAAKLDVTNEVDAKFFAELVLVKQTMEQLKELKGYVTDGAPDVFTFTISTIQDMEKRYGVASSKMEVVTELVKQIMLESTKTLVSLYNGKVLVQALVLQWDKPAIDKTSPELEEVYTLIRLYLIQQENRKTEGLYESYYPRLVAKDRDSFFSSLPELSLAEGYRQDSYLCWNIKQILGKGTKFFAVCPLSSAWKDSDYNTQQSDKNMVRRKRQADYDQGNDLQSNLTYSNLTVNVSVPFLVENRTNLFSAVFLIILFVTLSLGLAIFAVSWALWSMDPGDSIIYRQVSDSTPRVQ